MLLVANLAKAKWCKKTWKWLKPWHMGTYLRVLSANYPINPNMTGFRCFSKIFASCITFFQAKPVLDDQLFFLWLCRMKLWKRKANWNKINVHQIFPEFMLHTYVSFRSNFIFTGISEYEWVGKIVYRRGSWTFFTR